MLLGQSISLAHLAPFVDISRKKIRKDVREEMEKAKINASDEAINAISEERVRKEIQRGVQIIQYQVLTLMTTNGQTPFITVFMYLGEAKNEQEKKDLALIIEETLKQRYQGVKNEAGVWITPAFMFWKKRISMKIVNIIISQNSPLNAPQNVWFRIIFLKRK